jgi:hypothetical protein
MDDSSPAYWAALEPERLALRAMDKVRSWRRWFRSTGYAERALKGWRYSHGWTDAGESSSRLQTGGERGQLVKAVVNGVRPLRQRTAAMVLSGAPEMTAIASNSNAAAREQADLSRGVLEDIHRKMGRDSLDREVLNVALDMGAGALVIEWDARAGKPAAVKQSVDAAGQPMHDERGQPVTEPAAWEGDLRYWVASAFDIYLDPGLRRWEDARWVIVRRWVSRYRLAAVYPEKAQEILSVGVDRQSSDAEEMFDHRAHGDALVESDMVAEYVFWHLDGPELEGGREVRFLADGTWLSDGAYPYDGDTLPPQRLAPDSVACTALGYSNLFDALGLSDAINAIASAMTTNTTKSAVPPILDFANSGLAPGVPLGTGHIVLRVSKPELAPRYMEPAQTSPEAYKLAEVLERWRMETMGLNETAMGRPPFSGMAASLAALLDAKADEYQDGLRKGYTSYLERCATFELRILKRYAHAERIAQVAGVAKQWMTKAYTAESLSLVDGVHVEPVGLAARGQSGRLVLLETLKNFGVVLSAEQVVELLQTGQYESDFEAPLAARYGLREECEAMRTGSTPHKALISDKHWEHIPEHLALLDSPEARTHPEMVEQVLLAVAEHLNLWRSMPPDLLLLRGGPPPPPPAGLMPGMPEEGPPPEAGGAPPPSDPAPTMAAAEALDPNGQAPQLPQAPAAA